MSNEWIPIAEAKMDNDKRYEITSDSGHVYCCYPTEIGKALIVAVREYNPTPYVAPAPIDPGDGWRLLKNGEEPNYGDEVRCPNSKWTPLMLDFEPGQRKGWVYRRRIEPTYRPFANAAEYAPHRDRWIRVKIGGEMRRLQFYSNDTNWNLYFESCEFEDGTPFGVEITQ